AHCATEQRLQAVLEEHAREKLDWQQQHHDWQQRQQDWQQQQQEWQQRQQLLEKQLHDFLQQADLHAHIIAVSAANELAQLKPSSMLTCAAIAAAAAVYILIDSLRVAQWVVQCTYIVKTS
ncbi:hypothetical protein QJQ45_027873, partial [Haematococcus lacustris]